jgi:hypothetical protein
MKDEKKYFISFGAFTVNTIGGKNLPHVHPGAELKIVWLNVEAPSVKSEEVRVSNIDTEVKNGNKIFIYKFCQKKFAHLKSIKCHI